MGKSRRSTLISSFCITAAAFALVFGIEFFSLAKDFARELSSSIKMTVYLQSGYSESGIEGFKDIISGNDYFTVESYLTSQQALEIFSGERDIPEGFNLPATLTLKMNEINLPYMINISRAMENLKIIDNVDFSYSAAQKAEEIIDKLGGISSSVLFLSAFLFVLLSYSASSGHVISAGAKKNIALNAASEVEYAIIREVMIIFFKGVFSAIAAYTLLHAVGGYLGIAMRLRTFRSLAVILLSGFVPGVIGYLQLRK